MFSLVLSFAPKERTGWGLGIPQGVVLVVDVWMCGCWMDVGDGNDGMDVWCGMSSDT